MTALQHLLIAYFLSFSLLWGYAAYLWIVSRRLDRRQAAAHAHNPE